MNKTIRKTMVLALTFASAFFAFSVNANASTYVVNTTNDTQDVTPGNDICADNVGACSLRAAITEANAHAGPDIITLPAGTYTTTIPTTNENANANGDFDILSEITINGAGSATTIIQANAAPDTATDRVMHCFTGGTPVVINDVTLRNGRITTANSGGGLRIENGGSGNVTLNRVVITNNRCATAGGGIQIINSGTVLNVNDSTISNNFSGSGVAGTAGQSGGINCTVAATVNLTNTTVSGNTSNSAVATNSVGGGMTSTATTTITNCTFSNNTATGALGSNFGGGLYVAGGTTTISGSTFSGNTCTSTAAPPAGGVAGAIYNQSATLNISNSSITGNSAQFQPAIRTLGQAAVAATTNITNCTISGNTSAGNAANGGEGGGVVNIAAGTANCITTITGSTISGNTVTSSGVQTGSFGGGIENYNISSGAATVNLTNSTVSGNTADFAGGIYNDGSAASINSDYSTIASNTALADGGGLYQDLDGGSINLKNSIVADNTAAGTGPDMFSDPTVPIISQDYNHVEDTAGAVFTPSANDVTGTDPQLGPLANNGGPTMTHLPGATSPVLNTIAGGTSECGTTILVDQRGLPRPVGAGCEKGSVEVQATALTASGAVSRKVHGGFGPFDIPLPLSGSPGIECRGPGGGTNPYQVVVSFANPILSVNGHAVPVPGDATLTGTGSVSGVTIVGSTVVVDLTGVATQQQIGLTLLNVSDGANSGNIAVPMIVLVGDSAGTGNNSVNSGDIAFVKSKAGAAVIDGTNFRADIAVSGTINASDISLVKSKSGNQFP